MTWEQTAGSIPARRQRLVERFSLWSGIRRLRSSTTAPGSVIQADSAVFDCLFRGYRVVGDGRRVQIVLRPNDPAGARRRKGKVLTALGIVSCVLVVFLSPVLFFAAGTATGLWFLGVAGAMATVCGVVGRRMAPNDADETEEWLLFELRPLDNEVYDRHGKLPFRLDEVTFTNAPPAAHPLFSVFEPLSRWASVDLGQAAHQPTELMMKAPWYRRPLLPLWSGDDYDALILRDLPSAVPSATFRVWPSNG